MRRRKAWEEIKNLFTRFLPGRYKAISPASFLLYYPPYNPSTAPPWAASANECKVGFSSFDVELVGEWKVWRVSSHVKRWGLRPPRPPTPGLPFPSYPRVRERAAGGEGQSDTGGFRHFSRLPRPAWLAIIRLVKLFFFRFFSCFACTRLANLATFRPLYSRDYRFEYGRFPLPMSGMLTASNPNALSSREKMGWFWDKKLKTELNYCARFQKAIGGIYFKNI